MPTTSAIRLFDSSKVHDIAVTFATADYDAMVATFKASSDKSWIKATVVIDGASFANVGMRLKGNSTLMSLRGVGPQGAQPGAQPVGPGGTANAAAPESLPWLIRLDKFVDNQRLNGTAEIVIRASSTQTSINEAVALELTAAAGLSTQRAISTRFSVNGGTTDLRMAIENPGNEWQKSTYTTDGILYKAEASGDYSYRGDDPAKYVDVFDQESGKADNLVPLMDFLKFINDSDDTTFAAQLGDRFDVASFARYLAMQDVIDNFDDIDGPGNNSYLRYDLATKKMTVLTWDLNLAFGSRPGGPGGGFGGGRGGQIPPGGGQPPVDGQVPPGAPGGGRGGLPGGGPGGFPGGGPGGKANILVTRFKAHAAFNQQYLAAVTDLKAELYASGKAAQIVTRWTDVYAQATDLVDAATVATEAAAVSKYFG